MKNICIVGMNGIVAKKAFKYLLTEGKYNLFLVDCKNSGYKNVYKKYKKRVKIICGDILDQNFVEDIVKEMDAIIYLHELPFLYSYYKKELSVSLNVDATENFIRAINYYNPKCHFIYKSSTTLYKDKNKSISNATKIKSLDDNYARHKYKVEELIEEKLKYYTIVRMPIILDDATDYEYVYNVKKDSMVSFITSNDAGYLFTKIIDNKNKCLSKVFNVSSNDEFNMQYRKMTELLIKANKFDMNMVLSDLFVGGIYYSPVCNNVKEFNDILNYQIDTLDNYLDRVKYYYSKKFIRRYIGRLYLKLWQLKRK